MLVTVYLYLVLNTTDCKRTYAYNKNVHVQGVYSDETQELTGTLLYKYNVESPMI